MPGITRRGTLALGLAVVASSRAWAENAPGVTDSEIRIGSTQPFSGPASAFGHCH